MKTIKELIESHNAVAYVMLSKIALWLVAATLVGIVIGGVIATIHGNTQITLAVVQACQALSFISITVLGYHGYKGHRLFHELRHWRDPAYQPSADESDKPQA